MMASAYDDLTEDEQRSAEQHEAQLLALLKTAKETVRSFRGNFQGRTTRESMRAENTVQLLNLELSLSRLQRKDKNTIAVNCADFPPGHGRPLGQALEHNATVTTLALTTANFYPPVFSPLENLQADQSWCDYFSTTPSLVNVRIRGSGNESDVVAYMIGLTSASTRIQNLVLALRHLHLTPNEFRSLMMIPQSLQEVAIRFPDRRWTDEDRRRATEGLQAKANVLQRLTLCIHANEAFDDGDDDDDFDVDDDDDDCPMPTHVMKNLHLVHSLQALKLDFDDDVWLETFIGVRGLFTALERYLRSVDVDTGTFRRLMIRNTEMCESLMTKLLSGLGQSTNGVVQRVAVSELTLSRFSFDAESSNQLFAFLQTPTTDEMGTTVWCKSALRKLCVSVSYLHETHGNYDVLSDEQEESWWERFAESLLVQPDATSSNVVNTIGSQIEELHIHDVRSSFLHYIGVHAGRMVHLKHLGLHGCIQTNLSECLPKLATVTSLTLRKIDSDDHSIIVKGLKHNGSITEVFTGCAVPDPFDVDQDRLFDTEDEVDDEKFDEKNLRLMRAYAQRNKFLSKYHIGDMPTMNDARGNDDAASSDGTQGANDCGPLTVGVSNAPSVLRTAMIGPVSRLWHGLAEGGKHFGPDDDAWN